MNAPPVLRPLRAILQRRLQIVRARPIQTSPYYLRASQHYRLQRRYNSSIPPDQPQKSEEATTSEPEAAAPAPSEPADHFAAETETTSPSDLSAPTNANAEVSSETSAAAAEKPVSPDGKAPQLKTAEGEIKAGIDEALEHQLKSEDVSLAGFYARYKEAQTGGQKVAVPEETQSAPAKEDQPASTAQAQSPAAQETQAPAPAAAPATPSIQGFENMTPGQMAATLDFLQGLQAQQKEAATVAAASTPAPAQTTTPEIPTQGSAAVTESVIHASEVSEPRAAETVAAMTEPIVPSGEATQPESTNPKSTASEGDAIAAATDPVEQSSAPAIATETAIPEPTTTENAESAPSAAATRSKLEAMLDSVSKEAESNRLAAEEEDTEFTDEEVAMAATLGISKADLAGEGKEGEADGKEATKERKSRESRRRARMEYAQGPSRLPRTVQALYLQPMRRQAEYGIPSCDLQLRSYSVRPLESFADFALRAAFYLGLPAAGPVPLPKIIERWTVPRSSFIFKKSQENFERITRRRLIQIKDGHPETVQIWLAFLQKHQQAAVGMKANIWEFSSLDVAKEMDAALEESMKLFKEKESLLAQTKDFETAEKADEFLQSEKYRQFGGQFGGPDVR